MILILQEVADKNTVITIIMFCCQHCLSIKVVLIITRYLTINVYTYIYWCHVWEMSVQILDSSPYHAILKSHDAERNHLRIYVCTIFFINIIGTVWSNNLWTYCIKKFMAIRNAFMRISWTNVIYLNTKHYT